MTDQTEQERLDQLRLMSGQNMDSEWDKLTSEKPAVEEPVGRDLSWLNPIALLRSVFGSQKD